MGFWIFMCVTVLLIPFLMISFGGLFSRSAPKEINSAFGYRTSMSMKNADTWQFAHHYFGKIWRTLGWILIIPSVIPMLFVIGKGNDPVGNMVVDIGGGTTDIGVLTMNGIAQSASLKVAGAAFDEAIIRHLRRRYGLLIGTTVAEEIKMSIGCVTPRPEALTMTVKGRDLKNGLAREATLTSEELMEVLRRPARQIMDKVLDVLESTTPELVADIARNGIVLTGGGSQLFGMDRLLCERTEMTCVVADDADSCAAYGCGKSLSWMNHMQEGTINLARRRLLKE